MPGSFTTTAGWAVRQYAWKAPTDMPGFRLKNETALTISGLGPHVAGDREPVEVGVGQRRVRPHPHLLQEPVDLAKVLRGVPGRAFHEVMGGLRSVVRADAAVAPGRPRAVRGEPAAHGVAVAGDGLSVGHRRRGALVEPLLGEMFLLAGVDERRSHAEDVEAELAHGPVAAGRLHA